MEKLWEIHHKLKKDDWPQACFAALVEAEKWKKRQGAKRGPKGLTEGERLKAEYARSAQ